jgi:hypothetical protein
LEPRGDIDPVAHEVAVAFLHHVAEVDAESKLDARNAEVAPDKRAPGVRRLLELDDVLYRRDRRHLFLRDQLGGPDGSGDLEDDPARVCRPLSSGDSSVEAPEVRVTTTGALPMKTLNLAHVSRVVRALLIEADRDILIEDGPRRDLVSIPFDAAAAEDGLLPVFLVAAEAIWRDVTGRGFELGLKRDLGALMSWRIEAIRAEAFSCVLLSIMEALAAVARPDGVMVLDLARVFDEATARTEARKAIA